MERHFAAESWREVAGNSQQALSLLSGADTAIQEAVALAAPLRYRDGTTAAIVTLDVYGHLFPAQDEALAAFEKIRTR